MVSHEVHPRNSTTVFRLDDGDAFDAPRPKNTTSCPPPPPPPLPMMYPRRCGPGSHAASRLIVAPAPRGVSASNCPDEDMYLVLWLLLLAQSGSDFHARRPLTIVDVGMNKGYSIAAMLEGLALPVPHPSVNPSDWNYDSNYARARTDALRVAAAARRTNENSAGFFSKRMLAQRLYAWYPRAARANLNGGCAEERTPSVYHPSRVLANHPVFTNRTNHTNHTTDLFIPAVEVYGADGVKAHADLCNRFFSSQNEAYVSHSIANNLRYTNFSFNFLFSAVSSSVGTVRFPEPAFGNEGGKMGASGGVEVPMTTLAHMLPPHVDVIDILLTDTEGNDFDVYEGALERYLSKGRVGIYVFETHRGPNKRSLKSVLLELEYYGYECFFPLQGTGAYLSPITPVAERYHPNFDASQRGWKNVVCAQTTTFPQLAALVRELTSTDWNRRRR